MSVAMMNQNFFTSDSSNKIPHFGLADLNLLNGKDEVVLNLSSIAIGDYYYYLTLGNRLHDRFVRP